MKFFYYKMIIFIQHYCIFYKIIHLTTHNFVLALEHLHLEPLLHISYYFIVLLFILITINKYSYTCFNYINNLIKYQLNYYCNNRDKLNSKSIRLLFSEYFAFKRLIILVAILVIYILIVPHEVLYNIFIYILNNRIPFTISASLLFIFITCGIIIGFVNYTLMFNMTITRFFTAPITIFLLSLYDPSLSVYDSLPLLLLNCIFNPSDIILNMNPYYPNLDNNQGWYDWLYEDNNTNDPPVVAGPSNNPFNLPTMNNNPSMLPPVNNNPPIQAPVVNNNPSLRIVGPNSAFLGLFNQDGSQGYYDDSGIRTNRPDNLIGNHRDNIRKLSLMEMKANTRLAEVIAINLANNMQIRGQHLPHINPYIPNIHGVKGCIELVYTKVDISRIDFSSLTDIVPDCPPKQAVAHFVFNPMDPTSKHVGNLILRGGKVTWLLVDLNVEGVTYQGILFTRYRIETGDDGIVRMRAKVAKAEFKRLNNWNRITSGGQDIIHDGTWYKLSPINCEVFSQGNPFERHLEYLRSKQ